MKEPVLLHSHYLEDKDGTTLVGDGFDKMGQFSRSLFKKYQKWSKTNGVEIPYEMTFNDLPDTFRMGYINSMEAHDPHSEVLQQSLESGEIWLQVVVRVARS